MRLATIIPLTAALLALPLPAAAQTDDQYRMEIGGGVGLMSYQGDYNGSLLKGMQPSATVMLRRIFNPYMGLRMAATYGKIKGKAADVKTWYPDLTAGEGAVTDRSSYEFNNSLFDLSLTYEYNFWPYGTGHDYRGAKRLTPFVFAGLGATYASGGGSNVFTANVPIGIGVKYKLAERLNIGLEWATHFSLSDKLDGSPDPYGVKSSGLFKNTDCYSLLQLSLTYSFMPKCRTCHNQDE